MRAAVADKTARQGLLACCANAIRTISCQCNTTAPCVQGHGPGVHLQPDDRPARARQRGAHCWAHWVLLPRCLLAWPSARHTWLAHVQASSPCRAPTPRLHHLQTLTLGVAARPQMALATSSTGWAFEKMHRKGEDGEPVLRPFVMETKFDGGCRAFWHTGTYSTL